MSRSTHGKGRDDPELVRFVAQPTGKRSHVSENVRVRSTPCVATRWSFSPFNDCPKALRQHQTGYGAPYLNNLTQKRGRTDNRAITGNPGRWLGTNMSLGTIWVKSGTRDSLCCVKSIPDTAPHEQHADRKSGWAPQGREDLDDLCHDTCN